MKIKTIAGVVAAAVYTASAAAAVSTAPPGKLSLAPINLSAEVVKSRTERLAQQNQPSLLTGNGLNVQLQPKQKIQTEEGLTGSYRYIIQLKDAPAALYQGDQFGQGGTKSLFNDQKLGPRKVDLKSNSMVANYTNQLKQKQNDFVSKASRAGIDLKVEQQFQIAINAVTATLTQKQAEALSRLPEVAYVSREKVEELLMDVAPERTNAPAAWGDVSFSHAPNGLKGEGMLVGVIDTGISAAHPSFTASGDDNYQIQNPLGSGNFLHDCAVEGQESLCNDKLIGIWSTPVITDAFSDPEFSESRPANGQDYQGHGSHTASIAAGNVLHDVPYKIPAFAQTHEGIETGLVLPKISGIAPHANIISYQVCYPGNAGDKWAGCPSTAIIPAIEQAILDGVDVINYSISGGYDSHNDPTELAFLAAHEAGINVAASAGNAGAYLSVNHVSPWLLSVGSTETGRRFNVPTNITMELSGGNPDFPAFQNLPGSSYRRAYGLNTNEISGPMVLASEFGDEYCKQPFAAGTFSNNEIVFCARGSDIANESIPLVDKSANAANGGAQAVVIYNTPESETATYTNIPYAIPTFQVYTSTSTSQYSQDMVDWLQDGTGHMGTIPVSQTTSSTVASLVDRMSNFSSRGHAYLEQYREATAPSIVAPGTDIYSAYSSDQPFTQYPSPTEFNMISGTSMSSPHIAGALALVKQAHPEWTPSEVMSAMQLTAKTPFGSYDTTPWDRGSGIAQIDKAIHSGLIMNVPTEHYMQANPYSGGNLGALNTPNMVDDSCFKTCSWVREVTATVDGTWTVEGITSEYSVKVEASPSTFTLQAGETQRLIITGSWIDSRNSYQSPRGLTVFGSLKLTHEDSSVPEANMGVEMVLNSGQLPEVVEYTTHSEQSSYSLNNLFVGNAPELQAVAYEPAIANIEEIELTERVSGNGTNLFESDQTVPVHTTWVNVPANAKRLVAEVLDSGAPIVGHDLTSPQGNAGIYLGFDADGDNEIDYDEEVICKSVVSSSELFDWCNIPNPQAGNYWVVFQEHNFNSRGYLNDEVNYPNGVFPHRVATAVVSGEVAQSISIDTPASATPEEMISASINANLPDIIEGEKVYTAIELGSDLGNPDNIGIISANIKRGKDELSFATNKNGAVVGDSVNYQVQLLANNSGADRNYVFTAEIPDGLEVVADSVAISANRYLADPEITITGNLITISGVQTDSRDMARHYLITNSLNDASCGTPVGDGSYIDLNAYGFNPVENAPSINLGAPLQVSLNEIYQDGRSADETYALYNYKDSAGTNTKNLYLHSNGMINMTGIWHPTFGGANYPYNSEYTHFIPSQIGAFWSAAAGFGSQGMQSGAPYSLDDNGDGVSGITFVKLVDENNVGTGVVVEWDNIQFVNPIYDRATRSYTGTPNTNSDSKVDAQIILMRDYNSAPGAYEMVYAYDNLNFDYYTGNGSPFQELFAFENNAVAGVVSYASPWAGAPLEGFITQSIDPNNNGFGGLHQFLQNNMSVCFDYQGPEVTAFDINFQLKVLPHAIGQDFVINVDANIDGIGSQSMMEMLKVQSNLSIYDIADQETTEETAIEGIQVAYMDNNNVSNTISVSGEGITAVINGHSNGSTFDLIPNENFAGTTEVTVTVTDDHYATDSVSTKFILTVIGENDAPTAKGTSSSASEGDDVTLDASASFDVDGDTLTFFWEGPGSIADANAEVTSVSGLSEGSHTFTLTVSDGVETSTTEVAVFVGPKPWVNSGGGSMNFFLLILAAFGGLVLRRSA